MNFEQKQKEELEKLENALTSQSLQYDPKDPYSTDRTLYNPTNGAGAYAMRLAKSSKKSCVCKKKSVDFPLTLVQNNCVRCDEDRR